LPSTETRRFFGGASPVGRRVKAWGVRTVVGLVRNSKDFTYTEPPRPHFYLPFRQTYFQGQQIYFFVRAQGDVDVAGASLDRAARAVDANASTDGSVLPLADVNVMQLFSLKLAASLLAALGVIAFLLAAIGVYGVMSCSVNQRTQEMGIRMALGARPRQVLRIVVRQGLLFTAVGVAAGLALALASMRLMEFLLVGVSPFDPLTFVAVCLFLAGVAALASLLPALRATRVDPFTALRSE